MFYPSKTQLTSSLLLATWPTIACETVNVGRVRGSHQRSILGIRPPTKELKASRGNDLRTQIDDARTC